MTTDNERKRRQRERDAKDGIIEVGVRVPQERAKEIRKMADQMRREARIERREQE